MTLAYWCAATGQPAASWFSLTRVERRAFMEVAEEIVAARRRAMKRR